MKPFGFSGCAAVSSLALSACGPAPGTADAPPPPVSAASVAAPPAKPMVMVCKNSQTGADAKCGTPAAVMVGMKPAP